MRLIISMYIILILLLTMVYTSENIYIDEDMEKQAIDLLAYDKYYEENIHISRTISNSKIYKGVRYYVIEEQLW